MEVLELEKKLITILGNFTSEEIKFLKHIQPALSVCKEEANLNNENEINEYLITNAFTIAVVKKYKENKDFYNDLWNDFLDKEVENINNFILNIKKDINVLEDLIRKKKLEISNINKYETVSINYHSRELTELLYNINQLKKADETNLIFYKKYQKLIEENINVENIEFNEYNNALNNISKITLNKKFTYSLNNIDFNIEIDNRTNNKHTVINVDIDNSIQSFSEILRSFSLNFKSNPNIIPENWKKHINFCIKNINISFDGFYPNNFYFNTENQIPLTHFDYSFFIALRNNLIQKEFITADNKIYLPLSGGIMAQIFFKNYTFIEENNYAYVLGTKVYNDFNNRKNEILYKNSESLTIEVPKGYLFIYNNLWCEVTFHAAPILFENSTLKYNGIIPEEDDFDDDDENSTYYSKRIR